MGILVYQNVYYKSANESFRKVRGQLAGSPEKVIPLVLLAQQEVRAMGFFQRREEDMQAGNQT